MLDFGNINIYVFDSAEEIGVKAAMLLSETIKENHKSNVCFATGGSPVGMYKELIKLYNEKAVDFSGIRAFNLDEYYPIQKSNSQSYDYFMKDNLFNHINIDFNNQFIPNGETKDVDKECKDYDKLIEENGGIDFQILGIGTNGHIGFNEPSKSFKANTHLVELAESTINANSRFFDSMEEVPKYGITMGIKSIMMSKRIILIAYGENKAEAIDKAFFEDVTPEMPASILQFHRNVTVLLDKGAAKLVEEKFKAQNK